MQASKLDREITIRRATTSLDEAGIPFRTWTDLVYLRAELVENAATEKVGQSGEVTTKEVLFRTRFFDGVTVADLIRYDSADYNIKSVSSIGRRRGFEIKAERIGP